MYDRAIHHIDETENLLSHALASVAYTSVTAISSIVLVLTMIPEAMAVAMAQGLPVGIVASAVSLVTVKLALNDTGRSMLLPIVGKRKLYFGWPLYLINLIASLFMIAMSGMWVHLAFVAVSFCGAVSSDWIGKVIKADAIQRLKDRTAHQIEAEKLQNRLSELAQSSQLRMEGKQRAHEEKWSVVVVEPKPVANDVITMQNSTGKTAVTVDTLEKNREKAAETKRAKIGERRERVKQLLADDPKLTNRAIAELVGVSARTISGDRKALGI